MSNVKYHIEKLLSKEQVITSNNKEKLTLIVASETIKFVPEYRYDMESQIYDVLCVKISGLENKMSIISIEIFDYEPGYEYTIRVNKITQAEPYNIKYSLLKIVSKEVK
ncbi:MAG: DUF4377 domain-containing protein [Bacteroidales bacterium]